MFYFYLNENFDKETDFYRWNMQTNIRIPSVPFLLHGFFSLFFGPKILDALRSPLCAHARAHQKIEILFV